MCPPRDCIPSKFWWLYGGVNSDFLQEGLCHIQVSCTQSPCPCNRSLLTFTPAGDTQTLKRQVWLSLCGVSQCAQGFVGAPRVSLASMEFDSKHDLSLPSCWGFSFALEHGVSFFGGIQHSPIDGCSTASSNFGVLTGEDDHTSFSSTIL